MSKMNTKMVLGFISTLLKGCVLAKGCDIVLDADTLKKAELEFDLGIKDEGDKFIISLRKGDPMRPKGEPTSISLPPTPKIWTPPGS